MRSDKWVDETNRSPHGHRPERPVGFQHRIDRPKSGPCTALFARRASEGWNVQDSEAELGGKP